jgi:hypothetical protein
MSLYKKTVLIVLTVLSFGSSFSASAMYTMSVANQVFASSSNPIVAVNSSFAGLGLAQVYNPPKTVVVSVSSQPTQVASSSTNSNSSAKSASSFSSVISSINSSSQTNSSIVSSSNSSNSSTSFSSLSLLVQNSSTNSSISNSSSISSFSINQNNSSNSSRSSQSSLISSVLSSGSSLQSSSTSSNSSSLVSNSSLVSSSSISSLSSSSQSSQLPYVSDFNLESILAKRLPSGAISSYNSPTEVKINPYFQNLAVCGIASEIVYGNYPNKQELIATGWNALDWYKGKQDQNTGYIYDHSVNGGIETSIGNMDSVDAYVGTYFLALDCMYKATGDKPKLNTYRSSMLKSNQAITTIYDPEDKLYIAKPEWQVKYLMDNLELARGIKQSVSIFSALDMTSEASKAQNSYNELTQAIESRFWNSKNNDYYWAIAGKKPDEVIYNSDWSKCYADAKANVWSATWLGTKSPRQTELNLYFDKTSKDTLDTGLVPCKWNPFVGIAMANGGQIDLAQNYYNFGQSAIRQPNLGGIYTTGHDGLFLVLKYKLQGKSLII